MRTPRHLDFHSGSSICCWPLPESIIALGAEILWFPNALSLTFITFIFFLENYPSLLLSIITDSWTFFKKLQWIIIHYCHFLFDVQIIPNVASGSPFTQDSVCSWHGLIDLYVFPFFLVRREPSGSLGSVARQSRQRLLLQRALTSLTGNDIRNRDLGARCAHCHSDGLAFRPVIRGQFIKK